MTTIFENIEAGKPQTHVFIIGVGKYPHLLNGEGPILDNPMGLKQLTSPPISAKTFADWILENLKDSYVPLGSVELLLSSKDDNQILVDAATMGNIKKAFDLWYKRCDTNENNVAIFYFCGHGVVKNYQLLLAEDFGASPNRILENAINFRLTYQGMVQCKAGVQCYFIDSCQQFSDELSKLPIADAQALIDFNLDNMRYRRTARILYATSLGLKAFGEKNSVSRFTDALIQSLKGLGSKRIQDKEGKARWVVTTDALSNAVREIIKQQNESLELKYHQTPVFDGEYSDDATIHILKTTPKVSVTIGLIPDSASDLAELYIRKDSLVCKQRVPPKSGDWEAEIEAGMYMACAQFPTRQYHNPNDEDLWATTPYEKVVVRFKVKAI
ncbi:caspase family protein [Nostoc sp. LEGE 12450]|uniref:caspase family protein n=1 Tax=Nostoc sp. LEGE 12450 TaxID=1828643 RepID=UPI00187F1505|nr:caspase family protein [Nostoc sp. LEGE 12450]MBE8989070.1 caspase family protein [Nostoc sp. LEGE 12450]